MNNNDRRDLHDVTEQRRRFIINALYIGIILGIIYVVFRYAVNIVLPFVIAFVVSMIAKPIINWVEHRFNLHRGRGATLVILFFYLILGAILALLLALLLLRTKDWLVQLPDYYQNAVVPLLVSLSDWLNGIADGLSPELQRIVSSLTRNLLNSLTAFVSDWSLRFAASATAFASSLPGFLLKVLITIISTFFIALDYDNITKFIKVQLPERTAFTLIKAKQGLGTTIWNYLRSYSVIMFITFCEVWLGLALLGFPNALPVAAITAALDILPIIGSGIVLGPLIIIQLFQGRYWLAAGVLILWTTVTVVRNIIEPKIVGTHVGLHPVLTLMAMVVGTFFFGGPGLFGVPIALSLLKNLHDQGIIGLYTSFDEVDDEAFEAMNRKAHEPLSPKNKKDE